jgi:hypothetical protein
MNRLPSTDFNVRCSAVRVKSKLFTLSRNWDCDIDLSTLIYIDRATIERKTCQQKIDDCDRMVYSLKLRYFRPVLLNLAHLYSASIYAVGYGYKLEAAACVSP